MKAKPPILRHLLSMQSLDREKIIYLLNRAEFFLKAAVVKEETLDTLRGKVVVNLFFEPSTRTRCSFEIATHRLGAILLSPDTKQSSMIKGEILIDTILNLEAMGAHLLIVRHADNHLAQFLAGESRAGVAVINAGDGSNEHPTQALIDLLTIRQHYPDFSHLTIAIVGDVIHSRVARSLAIGLHCMGVARVRVIAPKEFSPTELAAMPFDLFHDMNAGLKGADVIYALRIQKERLKPNEQPLKDDHYYQHFGLTKDRLTLAKQNAIVMHAGPIIRGVDIESAVADGAQSVILEQTRNSVAVRMAVMETLLLQGA
ncbi:MAG: aspartate carbamoyltransferase [Gammaproteobacteria bacterium RIFCSPLOWO2_02_FULL_42_14]|nr:MAG: aspartate carbamoyltransferase [Gammaproteobacteria bacterium RIFCSPHIGHO2_02_FULL_42_43]OGT51592.1 MAG: aspartate carbamoyltransferase [Gammaproteobacteria bacterium RIFCSPHIGHO2_12_FULL_41_25]OGT62291.1 MAG: aspartate carbamoyltransferase [Gammaproteobacteria bacterium RIFCSPLOWO2_02_FULL_42_14]OGT85965.1 MAG: aspartate carbamoyltransferase [Gammaproteobacteria bacterium RIFCSPLOWO2_12_FULL_42_18]